MNFLREFFDRILMFTVFLVTVCIYWFKASPFAEQLVVTVASGLLGMLIGKMMPPPKTVDDGETTQIKTAEIITAEIKTAEIENLEHPKTAKSKDAGGEIG